MSLFTLNFFYAIRRRGPHHIVCLRAPTILDPPLILSDSKSSTMSKSSDQMCSVQCFGCRGNLFFNRPWCKMTDNHDNDTVNDDNNDSNRAKCMLRRCGTPTKFNVCILYESLNSIVSYFSNTCQLQ